MALRDTLLAKAEKIRQYAVSLLNTDAEQALCVATSYGKLLRYNYIGVFADQVFEERFVNHFASLALPVPKVRCGVLHLITTPYDAGGHTRVVERFVEGGLGDGVLSLDPFPESVKEKIPQGMYLYDGIRQNQYLATVNKILEIANQYQFVILHIHPEDICSTVAAGLLARTGVQIYLYNHSDHTFSFGYYVAHKVLEISQYGWVRGQARNILEKQSYVGVPISTRLIFSQIGTVELSVNQTVFNGMLSGNPKKFEPWHEINVVTFLNDFFAEIDGKYQVMITICGPSGQEPLWNGLSEQARSHLNFLGGLPYEQYLALLHSTDFYIDSFPQGNGTGFVEAVMSGTPAFGLNVFGGFSVASELSVDTPKELIAQLIDFFMMPQKYADKVLATREKIIREQSVASCIFKVRQLMHGGRLLPLPAEMAQANCMFDFFEKHWNLHQNLQITSQELFQLLQDLS